MSNQDSTLQCPGCGSGGVLTDGALPDGRRLASCSSVGCRLSFPIGPRTERCDGEATVRHLERCVLPAGHESPHQWACAVSETREPVARTPSGGANHTPEPWLDGSESEHSTETSHEWVEHPDGSDNWRALLSCVDYDRAVACVNACAGIPTDKLEAGAVHGLVTALGEAQLGHFHGCSTGDCPHNSVHECHAALGAELERIHELAKAALLAAGLEAL